MTIYWRLVMNSYTAVLAGKGGKDTEYATLDWICKRFLD